MGKYIRAILLSSLATLLVGCSGGTSTPNANEITMCGNQSITFNNYYEEHIQLCIKENNPKLYKRLIFSKAGACAIPGKFGRFIAIKGYRFAHSLVKFN